MSEEELLGDNIVTLPFVAARRAASAPAMSRFGNLYGASPAMQDVYRRIAKVAPTMATVFITGESGSGKEVVADTIHRRSERTSFRSSGQLRRDSGQSDRGRALWLREGAFTGAARMHRGCFERPRAERSSSTK
jgi:DNA-binding NtrC family response regulator